MLSPELRWRAHLSGHAEAGRGPERRLVSVVERVHFYVFRMEWLNLVHAACVPVLRAVLDRMSRSSKRLCRCPDMTDVRGVLRVSLPRAFSSQLLAGLKLVLGAVVELPVAVTGAGTAHPPNSGADR